MQHNITSTFLGIPQEIRMLIYDTLVGNRIGWIRFPLHSSIRCGVVGSLNILLVSKQVHDEAERALRVRTLRIHEVNYFSRNLLSRIPHLISRWASSIEKLSVTCDLNDQLMRNAIERERYTRLSKVMGSLREVIASLPKLRDFSICEKDAPYSPEDPQFEEHIKDIAYRLGLSLTCFNHLTAKCHRPTHLEHRRVVEIRFVKGETSSPMQVCVT